jgi:hypothetical protein
VTVRVYVVVVAGLTVTGMPLVTGPTLLSTLPVPPVKLAVRVGDWPWRIVEGEATKLLIAGAATTVTICCFVVVAPPAPVTVRVYV